jgi:putative phosphonate metabolism protein
MTAKINRFIGRPLRPSIIPGARSQKIVLIAIAGPIAWALTQVSSTLSPTRFCVLQTGTLISAENGRLIRYAIYFMPPPQSPLWDFGSSVLGYDANSGRLIDHPSTAFFQTEFDARYVSEPQKYGFHATLKAPFVLSEQHNEQALCDAADLFAKMRTTVVVEPLMIAALGPFLALVPSGQSAPLSALADDCVRAFDIFRAPAGAAERARRLAADLTPRQAVLNNRWGYPYVFDEFRFHMTLSSHLQATPQNRFKTILDALYEPIASPLAIESIAICKQNSSSDRFRVLARFVFGDDRQ